MPFKVAPSQIETVITNIPGVPDVDEENSITVAFRPATTEDVLRRAEWLQSEITRSGEDDDPQMRWKPQPYVLRQLAEIYLTMTACDIVNEHDKPLVNFKSSNGRQRVAGTFEQFKRNFGIVPVPVLNAIHKVCLQANPEWVVIRDEDDEENF